MSFKFTFPSRSLLPSSNLPLTLISLEDWALINLNGLDSIKYLHSQLTCDVLSLESNCLSFAAHCNAKGKIFSHLYVFHHHKGITLVERRSVRDNQLAELKKYAVFSKTTITADDEAILIGVAGFQAQAALSSLFTNIPYTTHPVMHYQDLTMLFFKLPAPRFMLITTPAMLSMLQHKLKKKIQLNNSQQWLALDIEAGYPIIDNVNSAQFIPQAVNIQALNGISFYKGCYPGQEIVTRAKYRGINKLTLYWLAGKASYLPAIGDKLELKLGDNWRRTGTVLATCQLADSSVWIQAVMNKNLSPDSELRVCNDAVSKLTIRTLPYVINE